MCFFLMDFHYKIIIYKLIRISKMARELSDSGSGLLWFVLMDAHLHT